MPDAFDNPLTDLRLLIATAMREYVPFLTAIGGVDNVQIWDRTTDLRGDLKKSGIGKRRAVLWPSRSTTDFGYSNSSIKSMRIFAIDLRVRDNDTKQLECLEWLLIKAFARLYMQLKADGTGNYAPIAPLVIDSIVMTEADPEREAVGPDTDHWTSLCDVAVTYTAALSDLIA